MGAGDLCCRQPFPPQISGARNPTVLLFSSCAERPTIGMEKTGSRGSLMSTLTSFHNPGYPGALPGVDAGVDGVEGREGKQAGKQAT